MKKFLGILLCTFFATASIYGQEDTQPSVEAIYNQVSMLSNVPNQIFMTGLQFCDSEGFSHFKIKHLEYLDQFGNRMEISGVSKTDKFVVHNQEEEQFSYSLYCYSEQPKDTDAVNVRAWLDYLASFTQQEEVVAEAEEGQNVISLQSKEELDALLKQKGKKLYIDLYSAHCPPCKTLAPKYTKWAEDNKGVADFAKVNIDDVPEIAEYFSVKGIPLLCIFNEERELTEKKVGLPQITHFMKTNP